MTLPSPKESSSSPSAVTSSWECCIVARTQLGAQPEPSAWTCSCATAQLFPFTSFLNILVVTASASALTKTISFIEMTRPVFTVSLWDELWGEASLQLREKLILRAEEAGQAWNAPCPVSECHKCAAVAALSARGVKSFAYEWECFLVAEVELGNSSPCLDCRATPPFHPRDSVTGGNPQTLSLSCVDGTNFSFSMAAVTSLSHPRWGGP